MHFQNCPPPPPKKKSSLLKNCTLPPGRNKRSVPKWKINVPTHGDLRSIVPVRWTRRVGDFHQMHIPRPSWLADILGLGLEFWSFRGYGYYLILSWYSVSGDGLDPNFSLPLLCDGVPINLTLFRLRSVLDWCVSVCINFPVLKRCVMIMHIQIIYRSF